MPKYLQLFKYLNIFIPWYKYKLKTYKMQKYESMSLNAPLSPQTLSLRRLRSRQPPPFVASVQSICQGRVGNPNVKTGKKCFDKLHFNEGSSDLRVNFAQRGPCRRQMEVLMRET